MTERPGETAEAVGASRGAGCGQHTHDRDHTHASHTHPDHTHTGHTHGGSCCGGHGARTARPHDPNALISARDLEVVRSGRTILSGVDLDIEKGEIVTLIGPNGAGKTTLVRTLLGLEKPDSGKAVKRPGLTIGYVPQRFDIDRTLPMTVARFLSLGAGSRQNSRQNGIGRVLEEVGASGVANQQLANLSGGELQRVLLARALLNDPDLLVLDEPVRGVDYVGEAELYTLIGRLRDTRGLGVLLISHDLHVVMGKSDRVICLNRHVCCSGVPEAVAQHPEYVRLFGRDEARAFAVYQHRHDHRHDLAGEPAPVRPPNEKSPTSNNGPSGGAA